MIAIVLLALVACASAAPWHGHHHHQPYHRSHHQHFNQDDDNSWERFMDREVFDTKQFWEELGREMMGLEAMLADMCRRFPVGVSDVKMTDNEYRLTISLTGYEEKEIAVKAKKGLLIIQAVHKVAGEPERNYLDVRTLPDNVDVNGKWTYENGVLSVVFPLERNDQGVDREPAVTQAPATEAPEHSREEVENNSTPSEDQNADVGVDRGDMGRDGSISNEIPRGQQTVEATTYAVDLKDDVELVPVNNFKVY